MTLSEDLTPVATQASQVARDGATSTPSGSRWYKTDLQIASPLGGFGLPNADLQSVEGRARAANDFVELIKASGIEVFAVTDHNSTKMLEEIRIAARQHGIVMFPGMELSTGTGADGVHLLLLGDPDADFQELTNQWNQAAGFDRDHPAFNSQGQHLPSRRSWIDILDDLPEDTIAIAPHILTQNGVASGDSIQEGSIKWRCLHHDRLEAVDVGHPGDGEGGGFNAKFRERTLNHFPAVKRLAYVSTSDAYRPDSLGRHSWIRMHEPDLASLRQALLDHDARIFCDWDSRLERDPNEVSHAYIKSIRLQDISTSSEALEVHFDPRITVVIGSRGSGKSTVVQGLRAIYGEEADLPEEVKRESQRYRDEVFGEATIASTFVEGISSAEDTATWQASSGVSTAQGNSLVNVRVVSQKELFERTAGERPGQSSPSANMLALVDEALEDDQVSAELHAVGVDANRVRVGVFTEELREKQRAFAEAAAKRIEADTKLASRKKFEEELAEINRKLEALDDKDEKEKLASARLILHDKAAAAQFSTKMIAFADALEELVQPDTPTIHTDEGTEFFKSSKELSGRLSTGIASLLADIRVTLATRDQRFDSGEDSFSAHVTAAEATKAAYEARLAELGVDLSQYESLSQQKSALTDELADLKVVEGQLPTLKKKEASAWKALNDLYLARTSVRESFTSIVSSRTPGLKFAVTAFADSMGWRQKLHTELGFRQGDHTEALEKLALWVWSDELSQDERLDRCVVWRDALLSNDYSPLASLGLSPAFIARLKQANEATRVSLATLRADDAFDMQFLKDGNDPAEPGSWQTVTDGSPGQRSAAMLAFTLSYGNSPLVLDQPEDDLDSALVSELVVSQFRKARWNRQLIVVTHEANIPVNTDSEAVVVLENVEGALRIVRHDDQPVVGAIDNPEVRKSIQDLLEGGVRAFINRERRYDNELSKYRADVEMLSNRR